MRLNNKLNEGRTEKVSYEFAEHYLKTKCKQAMKGTHIYRGAMSYEDEYLFVKPSISKPRLSPNASYNFYNLLMSNLPSWKQYPPRDKSLICTTDYRNASRRSLNNCYYVLPVDGSKIGVCPRGDIWDCFSDLNVGDMQEFNIQLDEFFSDNLIGKERSLLEYIDTDYPDFIKACNAIDEIKKTEQLLPLEFSMFWLKPYKDSDTKLIDYLNNILDPKEHDFELKKTGAFISGNYEVWTDGDSLLIDHESDLGRYIDNR